MKTLALLCLATALSGCVQIKYTDSIGRTFEYSAPAFGVKTVKRVDLTKGILEGYSSEQSQMVDFLQSVYDAGRKAGSLPAAP